MSKAPTFWFAERGFENSRTPCICMDSPSGGDPIIIAQVEPNGFWPQYVNAMCDAATRCFRMADELSEAVAKASAAVVPHNPALSIHPDCAKAGHDWPRDWPVGANAADVKCNRCGAEYTDA